MTENQGQPPLTLVESVRCLECGIVYAKPAGGSTVDKNPGCPECGYVGWISTAVPVTPAFARRRSVADPQLGRRVQSG